MTTLEIIKVWEFRNDSLVCEILSRIVHGEQKILRFKTTSDNMKMVTDSGNVLKTIITNDETWVYGYNPDTKNTFQCESFHLSLGQKVRESRSQFRPFASFVKVLCTTDEPLEVK